jgi:DNA-directed RNA polymerase specialized sigma24 family protein
MSTIIEYAKIDNQTFNIYYDTYKEYIQKISRKYGVLSKDEQISCGMTALWRCLANTQASHNEKIRNFKSVLYTYVRWECLSCIHKLPTTLLPLPAEIVLDDNFDVNVFIEDYFTDLPNRNKRIMVCKFVDGYTINEIAVREGLSKHNVCCIIQQSLKNISKKILK